MESATILNICPIAEQFKTKFGATAIKSVLPRAAEPLNAINITKKQEKGLTSVALKL